MKARIANIRKLICAGCPHPCEEYTAGQIDHANPAAACPVKWRGAWHIYTGSGGVEVEPTPAPTIAQILDQIEQGRAAWHWLHAEALAGRLTLERLKTEFERMIPRFGCTCLKDYHDILARLPFRPGDQFAWSVDLHNAINAKLGKRKWTMDEARTAQAATTPP